MCKNDLFFRFKKIFVFCIMFKHLPGVRDRQKVAPYTKNILQAETIVNKNSFFNEIGYKHVVV